MRSLILGLVLIAALIPGQTACTRPVSETSGTAAHSAQAGPVEPGAAPRPVDTMPDLAPTESGQHVYRVYAGMFPDREAAERMADDLAPEFRQLDLMESADGEFGLVVAEVQDFDVALGLVRQLRELAGGQGAEPFVSRKALGAAPASSPGDLSAEELERNRQRIERLQARVDELQLDGDSAEPGERGEWSGRLARIHELQEQLDSGQLNPESSEYEEAFAEYMELLDTVTNDEQLYRAQIEELEALNKEIGQRLEAFERKYGREWKGHELRCGPFKDAQAAYAMWEEMTGQDEPGGAVVAEEFDDGVWLTLHLSADEFWALVQAQQQ